VGSRTSDAFPNTRTTCTQNGMLILFTSRGHAKMRHVCISLTGYKGNSTYQITVGIDKGPIVL
jgi:hypothetical protein